MKKQLILIFSAAIIGIGVTSCKDKEDSNLEFAKYTVEENKENIEAEGLKVMDQMDDLKSLSSISTIQDFLNLSLRMNGSENLSVYNKVASMLTPVAGMDKNLMKLENLRSSLVIADKSSTLNDFLKEYGGTYTYNSTVNNFTYVKSNDEITFNFPIGESLTNNGKITLNNISSQIASNINFEGTELFKSLDLNIWNGNNKILGIEMDATYNDNDLPSSENIIVSLEKGFTFSETFTYNDKDIKWDFAFKQDKNNILSGAFDTKGNYSYDNINAMNNSNEATPDEINKFLNSANAWIQLGTLKISGAINFDQFTKDYYKDFSNDNEDFTKVKSDLACNILNSNSYLVLFYADKKEAIAKLTFNTVESYYFDYNSGNRNNKITQYTPTPSFVFSDGSAMDGSFFGTGFNELKNAIDAFLNEENK